MKTNILSIGKKIMIISLLVFFAITANSQVTKRERLAVLNIDAQGISLTPKQMGNLVRIQMEKLDTFEVVDRYDVDYLVEKNNLIIDNCFGKICLVETGEIIEADKMFSGSVELYGQTIIISFRLVDVKSGTIEKAHVREFLDLQTELQTMVVITINEMFGKEIDETVLSMLTVKNTYESALNNPEKDKLNLSGPRMGCTVFTGDIAKTLSSPKSQGGYDINPIMFQYGYQFEVQYLNEANIQALFEIIPNISGLGQGIIIPSISILQGIRHNVRGWEVAFGPIFNVSKFANGYYQDGKWHLQSDWDQDFANPNEITNRIDSRGDAKLVSGFIFGIGKSFKSGKLNIPVNFYGIPSKGGFRFGLSVGFNAKKK